MLEDGCRLYVPPKMQNRRNTGLKLIKPRKALVHLARDAARPLKAQAAMCCMLCPSRCLLARLLYSGPSLSRQARHASRHVNARIVQVIRRTRIAWLVDFATHVLSTRAAKSHDRILAMGHVKDDCVDDGVERSHECTVANTRLPEHIRSRDVKAGLRQVVHAENRLCGTQAVTCDGNGMTTRATQGTLDLPGHCIVARLEAGSDPTPRAMIKRNESEGAYILHHSCNVGGAPERHDAFATSLAHGCPAEVAHVGQGEAPVAIHRSAHLSVEVLS